MHELEIHELDADYVVIYLGWNTLGQYGPEGLPYKRARAGYPVAWYQRALGYFYTPRLYYQARRTYRTRFVEATYEDLTPSETRIYAEFEPSFFETNLRRILALTADRHPRVYALTLFTLTSDNPTPEEMARIHFPVGMGKNVRKLHLLLNKYNDTLHRVASEEGVRVIDTFELFASRDARQYFDDTSHLNERGSRLLAERLSDEIESDLRRGAR